MPDTKVVAADQEISTNTGERSLLKAIVRLAMEDWFYYKCQNVKDRGLADINQSKLYNFFFDPCLDDDYGSFNYITNHLSEHPEGLRESIRKYLISGATRLVRLSHKEDLDFN